MFQETVSLLNYPASLVEHKELSARRSLSKAPVTISTIDHNLIHTTFI